MIIKPRHEPRDLKVYRSLDNRMILTKDEKNTYFTLEKGYQGEVMFDEFIEGNLRAKMLLLNDLLFKSGNTTFQVDSLMMSDGINYLIDVKNFEGEYYFHDGKMYVVGSNKEIQNPFDQLKRANIMLRNLLQKSGIFTPIIPYLVFINPECTLFQLPLNQPVILPTQLNSFIRKLNSTPSFLNQKHMHLAEKVINLQTNETPYSNFPSYSYSQLKKGITCSNCHSFFGFVEGRKFICKACGFEEIVESAILRMVVEYKLLFPEEKVTTNRIYDWCKVIESKRRISRILEKNYKITGAHQWAYYE
ncbi:nuclease-related domain-containing protein [Neobacillus sp. LXY-1]|uniref:nuclease-related domain-containing protein n=1 Tax=Neobacillus sp. LXY-1 TaxID=3379133 RepID=UPI003EE219EB